MDYEILTAGTIAELVEKVKTKIAEGWEPLGGAFATLGMSELGGNGPVWLVAQTMHRPMRWVTSNFKVEYYPETIVGGTVNSGETVVYPQPKRTIPPESTAG